MAFRLLPAALVAATAIVGVGLILFGNDFAQAMGFVLLGVALFLYAMNLYTHREMEKERENERVGRPTDGP